MSAINADQNHVGILPQCSTDGLSESRYVHADFTLVHGRFLVDMVKLDRIFDGDDVVVHVVVDVIDHAGQGRRLSRSSGSGDQEQAAGFHAHTGYGLRNLQLLEGHELIGNLAQNHPNVPFLFEDRYTEPSRVAEREAEVAAANLLQFPLTPLRSDGLH